jgi:hypothetical protein
MGQMRRILNVEQLALRELEAPIARLREVLHGNESILEQRNSANQRVRYCPPPRRIVTAREPSHLTFLKI